MSDRYTLCELSTARPATSPNWPSAEPGPPKVVRNLPLLLNFSMRKFAGGGTGKAQSGPRGRQSGGPREACPVPSATYTFPEMSTAMGPGLKNWPGPCPSFIRGSVQVGLNLLTITVPPTVQEVLPR